MQYYDYCPRWQDGCEPAGPLVMEQVHDRNHSFQAAERRGLVPEYFEQPRRSKAAFLQSLQIGKDQFRRWRMALADGDLDTEQVSRKTG